MAMIPWEYIGIANGAPLSALAVLDPLAHNTMVIDAMTRKGRRAYTDQVDEMSGNGFNPSPLNNSAFYFRTGLTTLTVKAFGNGGGTHTLRVRLNGVQRGTLVLNNTEQTLNITISALGFADGSVVTVEMDVTRGPSDPIGIYAIRDAYVSPVSGVMGTNWPGVPTFGQITQGNLQQIVDAAQWCFDRMQLVHMPIPQGIMYHSLHNWPSTRMFWRGGIARSNGANRLYGVISYFNTNTGAERMRLMVDNVEVDTTPTIGPGEAALFEYDVDLSSYTDEQLRNLRLEQVVTSPLPANNAIATRWNLRWLETSQSTWSYSGLSSVNLPMESMTFSALQTRLNDMASDIDTVHTRIAGSTDMWDRQRLFRRSPTVDEFQKSWHARTYVARSQRYTDGLYVYGKGVKLIWGPVRIPPADGDEDPYRKWVGAHEEDIISGEFYQEKVINFNAYADLIPGTLYYLIGEDLVYVAETWQ